MTSVLPCSALNPFAPQFVPELFHVIEDFSPDWWNLIQTPAFQDFWLSNRYEMDISEEEIESLEEEDFIAEEFSEFEMQWYEEEQLAQLEEMNDETNSSKAEALFGALVKQQLHVMEKTAHKPVPPKRFQQKIPKFAPSDFHKVSSFHIQQPRA